MNNLVVDLDDPTVKLWGRLAVYALVFLAPGYANSFCADVILCFPIDTTIIRFFVSL
jgi:hypothetical protein